MPVEYLLTTNNFKKPTQLEGVNAVSQILCRLLLLKPGTNPLFPEMGVGLSNTQRYTTDLDLEDLRLRIQKQIATYLPMEYETCKVTIATEVGAFLIVDINIDGTLFRFDPSGNNDPDDSVSLDSLLGIEEDNSTYEEIDDDF